MAGLQARCAGIGGIFGTVMHRENITRAERAARRASIANDYLGGATVASLCVKYHATQNFVRSALREQNITIRHEETPRAKASTYEILAALINTDEGQSDIARRMGITPQRVSEIAKKAVAAGIQFLARKRGSK